MVTLTHHKKSVRALAIHPTEYSFASGSAGGNNIKKWKCPEGTFVHNFSGHNAIINTMSVNSESVMFSGGMSCPAIYPLSLDSLSFLQVITVLLHSGTITPERRSRTWMIYLSLVRSKLRQVCSVRPST